jgi:hypothetical protein
MGGRLRVESVRGLVWNTQASTFEKLNEIEIDLAVAPFPWGNRYTFIHQWFW